MFVTRMSYEKLLINKDGKDGNNLKTVYFLKQANKEDDTSTLITLDGQRQIETGRLNDRLKRAKKEDFDGEMDWHVRGTPLIIKEQLQIYEIVKDPNIVLNRGAYIWIPNSGPTSTSPKTTLYEVKLCGRLIVPKSLSKFLL